ncbi:MAG: UbiA family prenyltransferase [Pirellulaceae bacterium]|nr:UbiA family prenyltransferase [Pirellulaceae bacterium]
MNEYDISRPSGRLLDYLRLMRISNLFTAVADVAMGFLFVHPTFEPVGVLVCLVVASGLLYSAGMVLNDVFDVERDRRERPERPIPAGRIDLAAARQLGWGLLIAGLASGWAAGYLPGAASEWAWRSGAVATSLFVMILAYNAMLKQTPLGPLAMGSCRLFNVLLGMSAAAPITEGWNLAGFNAPQLAAAAGIGLYITGVAWLARDEATISHRVRLSLATATVMAGIAALGPVHRLLVEHQGARLLLLEPYWWMLLGMLAITILRRCSIAISSPEPQQVRYAVRHALWSLIMLDAALVLLVRDLYALAIVALLIPTAILGKWVAST